MTITSLLILIFIGLFGGVLSGFIGVGGGILIVPMLIYAFGFSQHMAQGTSLFLMLPPIGILAFYNYYKAGEVNIVYGSIIALTFVLGGYFGSKLSLRLSPAVVKTFFGFIMAYVAFRMIYTGIIDWRHE
ncbi:MAG: sulfite exporter TauE/SafE family protein [Bacteroidota bacterium]